MTAASADLTTPQRGSSPRASKQSYPVAATTIIYAGTMVAVNAAGNAVPASADSTLKVVGCAELQADNDPGAAGAINVEVTQGIFAFQNSATTEALTVADLGQPCYAADDQTLSRSSAAGARPKAGLFMGLDPVSSLPQVEMALDQAAFSTNEQLLISTSDLSSKQYYLVNADTALACILPTAAGQLTIGVAQTASAAAARARVKTSGISKVVLGGTVAIGDLLTTDSSGRAVTAYGADRVIGTALEAGTVGLTKQMLIGLVGTYAQHAPHTVAIPVQLATLATGNIVVGMVMGYPGRIKSLQFVNTVVVTTGSKAASLNAEIATVDVTGGVVALTSANQTPLGARVAGSAVTAANVFTATDAIDIEASGVTTFIEGAGVLLICMG